MGIALMFLLALYQMQSAIHSKIIETPSYNLNALDEDVSSERAQELSAALLSDKPELTELEFRYPISAIGMDYAKNSVLVRFQKHPLKQRYKYDPKHKSLQDNFMHFGKRQELEQEQSESLEQSQGEDLPKVNRIDEEQPVVRYERSLMGGRDSRGDNFMRFGRASSKQDFLRFGRAGKDFLRFGKAGPKQDFLRFGRAGPRQDFLRFGRAGHMQDFLRFGRAGAHQDFLRFGRAGAKQDFLRFGRPDNFMRFGRSPPTQLDSNFMRFGRSPQETQTTTEANQTQPQLQKNQIRAAVKLLKQSGSGNDESNPVDKAINMLFSKQQQQQTAAQELGQSTESMKSHEHEPIDLEIEGHNPEDVSVEQFYGLP